MERHLLPRSLVTLLLNVLLVVYSHCYAATNLETYDQDPTIESIDPLTGAIGDIVTITGTNFQNVTEVRFNGTAQTDLSKTSTTIKAKVPEGATTGTVSVFGSGFEVFSTETFTIVDPPTITSFVPAEGVFGDNITIVGENFTSARSVKIGVSDASFTVTNDQSIVATIQSGTLSGLISITTDLGTGISMDSLKVLSPVILDFEPKEGIATTEVMIDGVNFNQTTAISFNSIPASSFEIVDDSSINAVVPEGATTGPITVDTGNLGFFSSTEDFNVIIELDQPELTSPDNNRTGVSSRPDFEWMPVENALSYDFELATTIDFESGLELDSSLTDTMLTPVDNLDKGVEFFWRVRGSADDALSQWSEVYAFTTEEFVRPFPVAPADNASLPIEDFAFKWTPSADATSYRIEIDEDLLALASGGAFAATPTDTSVLASDLDIVPVSGTTYHWRVKALNDTQESSWSSTFSFQFGPLSLEDEFNSDAIRNFPNPFSRSIYFEVELDKPSAVSIDLYDVSGRHSVLFEGSLAVGNHKIEGDMINFPDGVYVAKVKINETTVTKRLIKKN